MIIRFYYIVMPVCAGLQTLTMVYMAVVLNKMRKGRRHEGRRT